MELWELYYTIHHFHIKNENNARFHSQAEMALLQSLDKSRSALWFDGGYHDQVALPESCLMTQVDLQASIVLVYGDAI